MHDAVTAQSFATGRAGRRRRSWYRRRLRLQRFLLAAGVGLILAFACWQNAARYAGLPSFHVASLLPDSFWVKSTLRANVRRDLALMAARSAKNARFARGGGVYPYSVIPGGIKDPDDLRYAALRDYVVRRHYARFDYDHAHLVRAGEGREVYLSYRIREAVYWTSKKVRLHPGELLLTDGKITARPRCGNQISDTAKPQISKEEPEADILDQPVVATLEPAPGFLARPLLAPSDLPSGLPVPPELFASNFVFPYVSVGSPIPSGFCPPNDQRVDGHCIPKHHKPVAPEPPTTALLLTGLIFIGWRYRRRAAIRA